MKMRKKPTTVILKDHLTDVQIQECEKRLVGLPVITVKLLAAQICEILKIQPDSDLCMAVSRTIIQKKNVEGRLTYSGRGVNTSWRLTPSNKELTLKLSQLELSVMSRFKNNIFSARALASVIAMELPCKLDEAMTHAKTWLRLWVKSDVAFKIQGTHSYAWVDKTSAYYKAKDTLSAAKPTPRVFEARPSSNESLPRVAVEDSRALRKERTEAKHDYEAVIAPVTEPLPEKPEESLVAEAMRVESDNHKVAETKEHNRPKVQTEGEQISRQERKGDDSASSKINGKSGHKLLLTSEGRLIWGDSRYYRKHIVALYYKLQPKMGHAGEEPLPVVVLTASDYETLIANQKQPSFLTKMRAMIHVIVMYMLLSADLKQKDDHDRE